LKLVKEYNIKVLESAEMPDRSMPTLADDKTLVATNDIELRKKLKTLGRKAIYLKSKKHLAIG
jgi:rRNA-processing protein FCF1